MVNSKPSFADPPAKGSYLISPHIPELASRTMSDESEADRFTDITKGWAVLAFGRMDLLGEDGPVSPQAPPKKEQEAEAYGRWAVSHGIANVYMEPRRGPSGP